MFAFCYNKMIFTRHPRVSLDKRSKDRLFIEVDIVIIHLQRYMIDKGVVVYVRKKYNGQ